MGVKTEVNKNKIRSDNSDNVQKLLSIVITGRNDDYMGDFKYRLSTCLNYLARNLKSLDRLDDVEIIITDWNSDIPLSKELHLLPEASQICLFVSVPPSTVSSVITEPGHVFSSTWAQNTGLRRARGEYAIYMVADTLVPSHSLQTLLSLLERKLTIPVKLEETLFQCGRRQIPALVGNRKPSLEEWDRYILLNGAELPQEAGVSGIGMCTAAQMMHRSLWESCRGNNQLYKNQGWTDIELTLRVTQNYPWVDLASIGVLMFEMNHWIDPEREPRAQKLTPHIVSPTFAVNDENWGLGAYQLEMQTAKNCSEILLETGLEYRRNKSKDLDQTREELLAQLTSQKVHQHLQQTNARWWNISSTEQAIQYALGWNSLYCQPRNYLEFGMKSWYAAAVVVTYDPTIEIYGIESWQEANNNRLIPSPDSVWFMLNRMGYRGYMRLVSGDPSTGFGRLQASFIGNLNLDLVLVRGDLFGGNSIEHIGQIISHLAPRGCLVFTCDSSSAFKSIWPQVQQKYPNFTYFQSTELQIGLLLAVGLQNSQASETNSISSTEEESVLTKEWRRSPKLSRWISLRRRIARSWGIMRGRIE